MVLIFPRKEVSNVDFKVSKNFLHQSAKLLGWSDAVKCKKNQSVYSLVAAFLKSSSFLWPWCCFSLWYINFTGTVFLSTLFWRADSLEFLQTLLFCTSRALGTFAWWTASLTHWTDYTDGSKSSSRSPIYMRLLWGFTASLLTNPIGFTLKWRWQDRSSEPGRVHRVPHHCADGFRLTVLSCQRTLLPR